MKNWYKTQRGYFAGALHEEMKKNKDIWLIVGDLGYGQFDKIRDDFPDRFLNVGAAEQSMVGIAVGLALEGKIPFCYTITSFYLRVAETISLYLSGEQANVKLVGGGRDNDYLDDGPSHFAYKTQSFIGLLNIANLCPKDKKDVPTMVKTMVKTKRPCFLSLSRNE
jgi:transketolase